MSEAHFSIRRDGSADIISGNIGLKCISPSINETQVLPFSFSEREDSILYKTEQGSISLSFRKEDDEVILHTEAEGFEHVHDIEPIGAAVLSGAVKVYFQGFGMEGPSGYLPIDSQLRRSHGIVGLASEDSALAVFITDHRRYSAQFSVKREEKLFGSAEKNFERLKAQYSTTEANIDRLVKLLEGHEEQLLKDIAQLDKLYDKNKLYFKEVSMYIEAGKLALEKAKTVTLPELEAKAKETGAIEDTQAAQDYADMITRFEKKIYDLELSRTVCLQTAPEIRMVQNSDTIMSEKIRSTIVNVIPMWKTQMVLALNNYHTQKAIEAQHAVTEATNEMLKKNADALHQSTVETAKARERGIVDIETLQHTNEQLITALDEIKQIQEDGRVARAEAEKELARIEQELKDKMLGIAANAKWTGEDIASTRTE